MRKLKLLFAACALFGVSAAWAQTDVTNLLTNPGFETSPIFDGTSLGSGTDPKSNAESTLGSELVSGAVNVYEISGWTNMTTETSDFARVFTMPYETTLYVNSSNNTGGQAVAAPANGSSVTESNNSLLLIEANWCQNAVLGVKQTVNLPIGVYKLTFDSYVSNTLANAMSLCGIKVGNVTTYKWPTAKDTWTNNEIYFTLDVATDVEFSMGYKKLGNVGGGSSAFLFVDNLKLVQIKNTAANSPTDVTNKIANADASSQFGSPWAVNNGLKSTYNTGKGYDGVVGFFEPSQWGNSSWSGEMYTELTGLSNGLYTLKAAVQSAEGVHTRLIAGTSNSSEFPATGTSNGTIAADGSVVAAGSGVAGWNFGSTSAWVTDGTLRIGVYTAAWAEHKWTNIDNFTLTYIPASEFLNLSEYVTLLSKAQSDAVAALGNSDYDNVTGDERTTLTSCSTKAVAEESVDAYEQLIEEVNNALSAFVSAKAAYDVYATEKTYAGTFGFSITTSDPANAAACAAATNSLKVEEHNYVISKYTTDGSALFIPTWDKSNFDALANEHWSGTTSEYFDKWSNSAFTSKIYKTVTLPEGHYAFYAAARGQAGASTATLKVKIGEDTKEAICTIKGNRGFGINTSGDADFSDGSTYACENAGYGWEWRDIVFDLAAETEVTLSIECTGNNSWVSAGDTKLLTYDNIAVSQNRYNTAKSNAEAARDNSDYAAVNGQERTDLVAAINAVVTTTIDGYNAAAEALENAYTSFTTAKATYVSLATLYSNATTLANVNNDNNSANLIFSDAIDAANTSTDQTGEEKVTTIKAAINTYIAAANPVGEGAKFDLTFLLTNPDLTPFWDGTWWIKPAGWAGEQSDGNFQVMQNNDVNAEDGEHKVFLEYYYLSEDKTFDNGKFNIYTQINLPKGTYTMSCYAFAKEQNYSSGAPVAGVYFYANDTKGSLINSDKLTEQSISFVQESVSDVKIGLKPTSGNTYNWMGIGYVQLFKVPAVTVTIDEGVDYTPESVAGQVTLKRTLAIDKWNTFVVPFQITNEELKAAFGAEVAVAEYSEASVDANDATVTFTLMGTPAIAPNKPVLLKPSAVNAENTYVFENRTIATGDAKVAGKNFDFVGSYAASTVIAEGDYYLKENKLWKSQGKGSTIAGTRAYIKTTTNDARITSLVIDGEETTGIMNVEQGTISFGKVYNMQGQQVKNAQKGIFIQNGKKIVVR